MSGTLKATNIQDGASATVNLALDSSGNVTVGNNLTVSGTGNTSFSGNVGIGTSTPTNLLAVVGTTGALTNASIRVNGTANTQSVRSGLWLSGNQSTSHYNWLLASQYNVNGAFEITPSTAVDGSTFSTPAVLVTASGNVGIGTTSPATKLHVAGTSGLRITYASSSGNGLNITQNDVTDTTSIINYNNGPMVFGTANTERMRIDSSGNLLVGTTATSYGGKIRSVFANTSQVGLTLTDTATTYTGNYVVFENSAGATAGTIAHNGATTVNYVASSDYRLKENVKPLVNSLNRVLALNPVSYDWVEDKSYGEGFIAHELQEHVPLAVSGIKDAVNEDGSIKPQGVDYGKLTTVLVAALQEAVDKITALEDRITKLESGK